MLTSGDSSVSGEERSQLGRLAVTWKSPNRDSTLAKTFGVGTRSHYLVSQFNFILSKCHFNDFMLKFLTFFSSATK